MGLIERTKEFFSGKLNLGMIIRFWKEFRLLILGAVLLILAHGRFPFPCFHPRHLFVVLWYQFPVITKTLFLVLGLISIFSYIHNLTEWEFEGKWISIILCVFAICATAIIVAFILSLGKIDIIIPIYLPD